MKKIIKIALIVFVLVIVLFLGFMGYLLLQRESEISKLPEYYQNLAEKCKESKELGISRSSFNCCLQSVKTMAEGNFTLVYSPYPGEVNPKPECSEGFGVNKLRCEGSYDWCEPISGFVCEEDSDCDFYYTKWGKDNPCFPCWYVSDDVICMNKEKKQEQMNRIIEEEFGGPDRIPLCTPCIDTDWDSFSCKCIDNECLKLSDYYQEIAEECKEKPGSKCCMVGLIDMVKNNYLLADENENCPEGFRPETQLCEDSLIWCEPIK